MQKMGEGHA
jgi:hypothetical protein